jgi:hypothetical protein
MDVWCDQWRQGNKGTENCIGNGVLIRGGECAEVKNKRRILLRKKKKI